MNVSKVEGGNISKITLPSCHIPFMHVFNPLHFGRVILVELSTVRFSKAVNKYTKRMQLKLE